MSGQTGPTPTLTLAQANGMYQMLSRLCSHLLVWGQTTRLTTLDTLWNLHYLILEYPRPEVICLWPKEQEPGLHQINLKYRHYHPTRTLILRRRTHRLPSRLQTAASPIHQTTRCETGKRIWYLTHSIKLIKTGTFYIWLEIQKETISTEKNVLPISPHENPHTLKKTASPSWRGKSIISRPSDMY